ncbi:MAG TPA: PHP domain-containing protein [Candidatus Dormibacteraeota bacterium]|nr:PHP domain-containing protein [Candidatus Dormibacteraeota bacterium]
MAQARPTPVRRRRHRLADDPVVPPAPSPVDLHTHTTRSDGVLAPGALVAAAHAVGVRILAISDHDTLAGYRELVGGGEGPSGLPAGLQLIPAVEINAVTRPGLDLPDGELHVLGYGVDPADDAFEASLARQREARRVRFWRTVARLRELGLSIDRQVDGLDPSDEDALGRPTIGRALIAAGHAASVEDAFSRLIGRGGPGYVPREGLGPVEAIGSIRRAGGLASLAHFGEAPSHLPLLEELRDHGLGGLEVHYRSFAAATVEALREVASTLRLRPTGGSDYHGDGITYAEQHAALWVPLEVGEGLLAALGQPVREITR